MVSEQSLQAELTSLLGEYAPRNYQFKKVAKGLNRFEEEYAINLSAYGFFMWCIDKYGSKILYGNMTTGKAVEGYAKDALKYRDDLPSLMVNAVDYVSKIFEQFADIDQCFTRLVEMTYPYILYVLFAADGHTEMAKRFRPEIEEQLKRYPSTLDSLPESFRKIGEEVQNAGLK